MTPLLLLACASAPTTAPAPSPPPEPVTAPAGISAAALHILATGAEVHLDGVAAAPYVDLLAEPVNDHHAPLVDAIRATDANAAWLQAADDAEWYVVRKLIGSAQQGGVEQQWLATGDGASAYGPQRPVRAHSSVRCPDGVRVAGVDVAYTVSVERRGAESWARATARFRALVPQNGARVAGELVPDSCWEGVTCEGLFDDAEQLAACKSGGGEDSVALGDTHGCLLPLEKSPADRERWVRELPITLKALGVADTDDVIVVPEARARYGTVLAVLAGFEAAGMRSPSLALTLVEGNDGPPVCNAPVRAAAQLHTAAGRWAGRRIAETPDPG